MKLHQFLLFNFLICFSTISRSTDIFKVIESNDKKAVIQWLKSTQDVNVLNEQGETPLIAAVKSGSDRLVKQLLKHKSIDVNRIDNVGKTALDYAVESDHRKSALLLGKRNSKVTTETNYILYKKMMKSRVRYLKSFVCLFNFCSFVFGSLCIVAAISFGVTWRLSLVPFFGYHLFKVTHASVDTIRLNVDQKLQNSDLVLTVS